MEQADAESAIAVKRVILASAPERKDELARLWEQYSPSFQLAEDKVGFALEAGAFGLVLFTQRTMLQMWLLGFAAQQSLFDYCGAVIFSSDAGVFYPEFLNQVKTNEFDRLMESFNEIATSETVANIRWPSEIPKPKDGRPSKPWGAVVFDLNCIAAAYCFLHEVEHIRLKSSGEAEKLTQQQEELACDKFARAILLDEVEKYSESSGYAEDKVTTKRAIGIGLTCFFLLAITPRERWGGSRSHPPIAERIRALTDSLALDANGHFWIYLSCVVIAHLRSSGITMARIQRDSHKELCLNLLNYLPGA